MNELSLRDRERHFKGICNVLEPKPSSLKVEDIKAIGGGNSQTKVVNI